MFIKSYNQSALMFKNEYISYDTLIENSIFYGELAGVEKGWKCAIFAENRPEWLFSLFGIWNNSSTAVLIDFMSSVSDVSYILNDCRPNIVFASEKTFKILHEAMIKTGISTKVVVFERNTDKALSDYTLENQISSNSNKNEVAVIIYTSGTTGSPKGVMLTFDNLFSEIESINRMDIAGEGEKVLSILPFHHSYPLIVTLLVLHNGGCILIAEKIVSDEILSIMKLHAPGIIVAVPRVLSLFHRSIFNKINASRIASLLFKFSKKLMNRKIGKILFKKVHATFGGNVNLIISGGAKLDFNIASDFTALGFLVSEGYGLTETSPIAAFNGRKNIKIGSVGKPLDIDEISIVDGEIAIKGPNLMKGYYNKPEETKAVIKNGWFFTGDTGHFDNDGYLYITGRKKDIIVLSNGKNINPEELENDILAKFPLIKEIAIAEKSSLLHAYIFPDFIEMKKQGMLNIHESIKWQILDNYNSTVPPYKKITSFSIVNSELPKTRLGKIKRFELENFSQNSDEKKEVVQDPTSEEYAILKNYLSEISKKPIAPNNHIELDLGLDSLEKVELQVFIEKTFGVPITSEDLSDNLMVLDLSLFIEERKTKIDITEIDWKEIFSHNIKIQVKDSSILPIVSKLILYPIFKLFFKLEIEGLHNIPDSPTLFTPNHQSFLDGFLISAALPWNETSITHYFAKEKHFKTKFRKTMAAATNILIADINKNLRESLQKIGSTITSGRNFVIFPEGTRTKTGDVLDFKKSFAIISKELNIPVIPVAIHGAFEAFPPGKLIPVRHKITIKFLSPVYPADKKYEEIITETRNSIINRKG